jgi:hypothetical protein
MFQKREQAPKRGSNEKKKKIAKTNSGHDEEVSMF